VFRVVTLEREYGAGGGGIAKALAHRLGWKLWDHELTCDIARRMKCDVKAVEQREEKLDPTYYRLVKYFMRGSYEDRTGSNLELLDAEHLALMFENAINDIASGGNAVIVGRGASWFLRNRQDAFHVFIYASHDEKIRRLTALGKTLLEAEELVETVDRERAAFIKKYHGKNWPSRDLYDIMINSKIGDEAVIETIISQMERVTAVSHAPVRT
jgi:cytidylate kinase